MTRIVVNHLTRMDAPRICVAGIDVASRKHVRPVAGRGAQLDRGLLADAGGPLELGAVVELGSARSRPDRPEVEDVQIDLSSAVKLERLGDDEYLSLVDGVSDTDLESAFGPDLLRRGWKYAVDLRLYGSDHRTLKREAVENVQKRLGRGVGLWIMFGLARPFSASGDDAERHWLQVNGLCLEDRPLGSLP